MATNSGNKGVLFAVLGVAAALGVTLYLLTRKSKKIQDLDILVNNSLPGGYNNIPPSATQPYVQNGNLPQDGVIQNIFGDVLAGLSNAQANNNTDTSALVIRR